VVGERRRPASRKHYDQNVLEALRRIWMILDFICGKRLVAIMPEVLRRLEYFGELKVDARTRAKLLKISAATIDRLLSPERRKHQLRGRARTKPGTLLKKQIPLRTFSEWNEQRPGFVEIDLVAHDGGLATGEYLYTLDMTDVYSGWTEVQAIQNKAHVWVFAALKELRAHLPFALQASILIMARSSSTTTCWSIVSVKASPSRVRDLIARTTTVLWNRRTARSCGATSAISVWRAASSWRWSMSSTVICDFTPTIFSR